MENHNRISSIKIILMGQLMVNIPVTIIVILAIFISAQIGLGWILSCIIGSGVGWYFWSKLFERWKDWALKNNVDRDRIFRLGKIGFINFYKHRIFD